MGRNRNKKIALIEKRAVWQINFTVLQAKAFWYLFGSRLRCFISQEDFMIAAKKGDLLIEKNLSDSIRHLGSTIEVYVWSGNYEAPIDLDYYKGRNLIGQKILRALHKEVGNKGDTEITWIEKMLNLSVEE